MKAQLQVLVLILVLALVLREGSQVEASLIIPSQDILLDGAVTGTGTESDAGTETEPRNGSGTERGVRNYLRSGHFIWQCCNDAL